ncbi:unnamed protein product, partial [Anisakis simplex]|uniref:PH domain-containing protein n=1 Tax=Anisakis simplex TaxID=6269 RepID=A0A0M3KDG6_ANISI
MEHEQRSDSSNEEQQQYKSFVSASKHSDLVDELTEAAKKAVADLDSDSASSTAGGGGRAKSIARKWEEKLRNESDGAKKPKVAQSPTVQAITPKTTSKASTEDRINWRLDVARKSQTSKRIDVRSADVKNLRNRWEISSATGTPLHPDQRPDELMEAAVLMSRSVRQARAWNSRSSSHNDISDDRALRYSSPILTLLTLQKQSSNIPTVTVQQSESSASEDFQNENSRGGNEGEQRDAMFADSSASANRNECKQPDEVIDDLFSFINQTPNKNSSLLSAMLNTPELHSADTSETQYFCTPEGNNTAEGMTILRKKLFAENLPLAHSVSFYRKKKSQVQHSHGDTIVLGQFTSTPPKDAESSSSSANQQPEGEHFLKEKARLEQEILIQEKQVAQATRALHFCRNTEEFRGSREQ